MQDLTGVGPGGDERVVAPTVHVTERGALLGVTVDLEDRRVDIHPEHAVDVRTGAGVPRSS
jgi:hypothetical protein